MKHLAVALLCVGCGGDTFSNDRFEDVGEADSGSSVAGGARGSVSSGGSVTSDAGSYEGGSGGSGVGGFAVVDSGATVEDDAGRVETPEAGVDGGSHDGSTDGSGAVECANGDVQCVGAQRQTCIGGIWLDNGAACEGWCIDGACVECKPGDRSCASETQPRTCDASGSWAFDAACSGTEPWCEDGACFGLCCTGGSFQTYCSDSGEPWHEIFSCGMSDCTNLDQCAVGSGCLVPNSYAGTIERCL